MYEELLPDFYRIEVPLPNNPLRALNCYLVKGFSRNLLIDNGFNTKESYEALSAGLDELGINLVETDFFLTHLHSDHNGLTSALLKSPTSKVMCSHEDGARLNHAVIDASYWPNMFGALALHGFPKCEVEKLAINHPGKIYQSPVPLEISPVEDGDIFGYGRYSFTVVEVPGHTPGHVVLYEETTRTLVSGDHILGTITPNITCWTGVEDSLGDYLKSLDKVKAYTMDRTFPAHRGMIEDTSARIDELKSHHAGRLDEICTILAHHGRQNAYGTASYMRWSLRGITWDEFKVQQKCFATGETLAHLEHLAVLGRVRRIYQGDGAFFELA